MKVRLVDENVEIQAATPKYEAVMMKEERKGKEEGRKKGEKETLNRKRIPNKGRGSKRENMMQCHRREENGGV